MSRFVRAMTVLLGVIITVMTPLARQGVVEFEVATGVSEVAQSRTVEEYLSRAQQSASPIAAEKKPAIALEEASIRPSPAAPQGARGLNYRLPAESCNSQIQVTPGRFIATRATVYHLIGLSLGRRCPGVGIVSGGPEWLKTERFDIQAIIPKGAAAYTMQEFMEGNAPGLQAVLQNLLADRFTLVLRHESKQMQGSNLIVVTGGKLKPVEAQDTGASPYEDGVQLIRSTVAGWINLQESQGTLLGSPVVDKSGLKGVYDIRIKYPQFSPDPNLTPANQGRQFETAMRDRLPSIMQEQHADRELDASLHFLLEPLPCYQA